MKSETLQKEAPLKGETANDATPKISKEALAIMENVGKVIYFPEKYFKGQRSVISDKTKEIHSATPTLPIRQVVVQILSELPDFLPPENILDVTRQIVEQWQKLSEEAAPIP